MVSQLVKKTLTCFECLIANSAWSYPMRMLLSLLDEIGQKVEIFSIKGEVQNNMPVLNTLFCGTKEHAHQFAHLSYANVWEFSSLGKSPSHLIRSLKSTGLAPIVVICKAKAFATRFLRQGFLLVPGVTFTLALDRPLNMLMEDFSRRRRRDIKKLRELDFTYTISTNNRNDLSLFYWKMYLPYTKERFGKSAFLKTYAGMSALYRRNGGIIFVKRNGKHVAGMLFQIRGEKLYALSLGMARDKDGVFGGLAGQAALYLLIEWAIANRLKVLDYGVTLPFLRDGLFQYKREWGMHIEEKPEQIFWAVKFTSLNDGALSFLENNPFVFLDGCKLKAAVFLSHRPTRTELQEIFTSFLFPKLDSLFVVSYFKPFESSVAIEELPLKTDKVTDLQAGPLSNIFTLLLNRGFDVTLFSRTTQNDHTVVRVLEARHPPKSLQIIAPVGD